MKFLLTLLALGICFICLLVLLYGTELVDIDFSDVRVPLWQGSTALIIDNPVHGTGKTSFESVFYEYRPIDYFLRAHHFAERSPHPHNQLLFIAATSGMIGLLAWLLLWIYPLFVFFRNFKKYDNLTKITAYSLTALIISSLFDMSLEVWPIMSISCILLAFLYCQLFPENIPVTRIDENTESISNGRSWFVYSFNASFLVLISILLFFQFSKDIQFSFYKQKAWQNQDSKETLYRTLEDLDKASLVKKEPLCLYQAGIISSILHDPVLGLYYFNKLQETPGPQIAHSNRNTGKCLLEHDRKHEALSYFRKETKCFPVSIISLYEAYSLEKELGLKSEANLTSEKILYALNLKGMTTEDIGIILKNPYYDINYHEFIRDKRNKEWKKF